MKLVTAPENPIERLVMALGLAPVVLLDTHMSFLRARSIMTAVRLGVFDALAGGPLSATHVAERCNASAEGIEKLLNALVGAAYLRYDSDGYRLAAVARKWLVTDSPTSVRDKVLFEFLEWDYTEHIEAFVKTGQPLEMHQHGSPESWRLYQRAMRALSGLAAPEIIRRTPIPKSATTMLDVGGSHGFISVAMCRQHPALRATVLDLPAAIAEAAPILSREAMGDRVVHRAGDALTDDLGDRAWDFVYVSQLLHHFDARTNQQLMARIARALKPGGIVCILEMIRPASPGASGQVGALLDLYFAVTSQSGTWSIDEIAAWQRDAGLAPLKPVALRTVPGAVEVLARRV